MMDIQINYLKLVNYALCHNGIAICNSLRLTNTSARNEADVWLVLRGEYVVETKTAVQPMLHAGESIMFKNIDLKPNAERLLSVTERVLTSFKVAVYSRNELLCENSYELEIMPFDHWLGTKTMPQCLASFVTPNHPAINEITIKAATYLKSITGRSSFTEYQTGNPNDVCKQVAAVFAALHQEGIVYRSLPASFEESGQRLTLPDQVLATKLGNCIELTLLFASILENIGINSVVVMQSGHAYLGVWLVDDSCPQSVCDDASYLEKKCSNGINEMIVLESTAITDEHTTFDAALKKAEKKLAELDQFIHFVDIYRCRLEHIRPLPIRIEEGGVYRVVEGIAHDSCRLDVREHHRYDLSGLQNANKKTTRFDIWERKLLDFSLRNSLLNLNLRRKAIQFMSFDVNRIEDHLQEGEEYSLYPKIDVDIKLETDERIFRSKIMESYHKLIKSDIEHKMLHTYLSETETKSVLTNIYRAARNAVEETGANSLFLSIGLLRWYENPQSVVPRFAPLLLLPVEMVYKKGRYFIRTNDQDISLNITLIEYLKQVHNITIKGIEPLPKDASGVDVPLIFTIIRDALKEQKGWDVEEECVLGTFSFSKFLMWNDIHSHREALLQNNIISSLVSNRLTWTPPVLETNLKSWDETSSPMDINLPMPADSSQMSAIIAGGQGHSYILYGPPGTGKSQTITNLIANALYHGKRVLFVAEKMAALSVVQRRLEKIGLAPFCLELHSNKTTKRHVLEQLDMALKVSHIVPPKDYEKTANRILEHRKLLIQYIKELHKVDEQDGLSLYDCILHYEAIDATPLANFHANEALARTLKEDGTRGLEEALGQELETTLKLVGQPSGHPLKGLRLTREEALSGNTLVEQLRGRVQTLSVAPNRRQELEQTQGLLQRILKDNHRSILQQDPKALYDSWREAKAKWFLPRYFAKKNFLKGLKAFNPYITEKDVDRLLDDLLVYKDRHDQLEIIRKALHDTLEVDTQEDCMPDAHLLDDATARITRWIDHADKMRDWVHWSEYRDRLKQKGLGCVVEAIESTDWSMTELRDAFFKAFFLHKAQDKMQSPVLSMFEGMLFDEKVKLYKQLADEFQMLTQKELYARLAANVPRVTDSIDSSSEIGLLNRNICNGGRGLSLRDLFDQIPTLLPRLCPCMLMSPMSVAQYVNLNSDKVDLVVFDEASQMPTSEAVGAIARGKSLIVVGDPKQMPPTSFFSSTNVDEEEAVIDDMDSILEDCRTLEMPSLQLNWHYRSRHESLIAFSNNEYYDGRLITFPSVDDQNTKVKYVSVDGCYDKGNRRTNKGEAEAIVAEIVRRLQDESLRKQSIGVIAFSVVQQSLIEDILMDRLESDKTLKELADALYEPIFIKNLENVQGDERDVILFSIGYGPDKDGKVSMNFGPLNNAGGERRLNVAVSRARREMMVFSTLKSTQIDLRRTQAKGVEGLKHFLEYAETQSLVQTAQPSAAYEESLVAQQIAEALTQRGYIVKTNIGKSQFKVNVAITDKAHPDVYKLGLLLDGKPYYETQTTRDREIVQPSVLASLNWSVMRVWTLDWFNNKQRVIDRIIDKYNESPTCEVETAPTHFDISHEEEVLNESADHDYKTYTASPREVQKLSKEALVDHIVRVEQPITLTMLCRRICTLRDLGKVTAKMQNDMLPLVNAKYFVEDDRCNKVVWLTQEDKANYQTYRKACGRDVADIPMAEIKNVLVEALHEQLSIQPENLTLVAAKKLGFTRRGTNVDAAIKEALNRLLQQDIVEINEGRIRMKSK